MSAFPDGLQLFREMSREDIGHVFGGAGFLRRYETRFKIFLQVCSHLGSTRQLLPLGILVLPEISLACLAIGLVNHRQFLVAKEMLERSRFYRDTMFISFDCLNKSL